MNDEKRILKELFTNSIKLLQEIISELKAIYPKLLKRLRFSITFKTNLVYIGIFFSILLFINFCVWGGFVVYLGRNAENTMYKDFKLTSSFLSSSTGLPSDNINELAALDKTDITLFDENRKVIFTTEKNKSSVIFYDNTNSGNISGNGNYRIFTDKKSTYNNLNLVSSNQFKWNSHNIHIQVIDRLSEESFLIVILVPILLCSDIFFILTIIPRGSKASKKLLKPIEEMTNTAKNITVNAMDTRLNVSGSKDELKDLAETFNNMLDRLQQSYEQQNQFVSDASHELRTPISVIQGYANLLSRWGKEDRAVLEEAIEAIKSEAESMKTLIEQLLFLARGDKNTQKIEKQDFDLNELIEEITKETRLIDDTHEISCDKSGSIPINADRKLLKEALRIFMDNSIKYTPKGGRIKISSQLVKSKINIVIEDTGIGISKEDLPNIFNRFYRADKSRTKETGGTGLGLAIAKWIIQKHKGTIEVESKVDMGTKIRIIL